MRHQFAHGAGEPVLSAGTACLGQDPSPGCFRSLYPGGPALAGPGPEKEKIKTAAAPFVPGAAVFSLTSML